MPERFSRIIVALEALVLLAPTSLIALWAAVFLLGSGLGDGVRHAEPIPLVFFLISTMSLACGWVLVVDFVAGGWSRLQHGPILLWIFAASGAVLSLASAVVVLISELGENSLPLDNLGGFGLMAFGAPALIPFAHVLLERVLRTPNSAGKLESP